MTQGQLGVLVSVEHTLCKGFFFKTCDQLTPMQSLTTGGFDVVLTIDMRKDGAENATKIDGGSGARIRGDARTNSRSRE